jgi:hypothetical protein
VRCPDHRIGSMSEEVGGRRCGVGSGDGVIVDRVWVMQFIGFVGKLCREVR